MKDRLRLAALPLSFMLLAISACQTEKVAPNNVLIANAEPGPEQGAFEVSFASTAETYQADQARYATTWNDPQYHVLVDGQVLAEYEGTAGSPVPQLLPISVGENGLAGVSSLDAGMHHFTIVAPDGEPIFQGDGEVVVGGQLRLFLFGPLDALQGRFVVIPATPSAGNEHVTVINLMRSGQAIEVVSCADATSCTPISPALAMGDLFDAEVPAVVSDDGFASLRPDGSGVGFRLVPSASLPNPPLLGLYVGSWGAAGPGTLPAAVFISAPVFISEQGQFLAGFN